MLHQGRGAKAQELIPVAPLPAPETPTPSASEKPPREKPARTGRTHRVPWADLKRVFAIDVLACPDCDGRMQLIAFIAQATVAKRILDHLGLP